jgi:serine/threonine protein kinase
MNKHGIIQVDNILYDRTSSNIKISNFFCATQTTEAVTRDFNFSLLLNDKKYLPPEIIEKKDFYLDRHYPKATDCWSMGLILYFVIYFRFPFSDEVEGKHGLAQRILSGDIFFPRDISLHDVTEKVFRFFLIGFQK